MNCTGRISGSSLARARSQKGTQYSLCCQRCLCWSLLHDEVHHGRWDVTDRRRHSSPSRALHCKFRKHHCSRAPIQAPNASKVRRTSVSALGAWQRVCFRLLSHPALHCTSLRLFPHRLSLLSAGLGGPKIPRQARLLFPVDFG